MIQAMKQALEALEYDNPLGRNATITALRQSIEQQEKQDADEWYENALWGEKQERNFCQRCGKRLGDGIHTCTPPEAEKQEPVWCGCGDGIVANDDAKCGVCVMRLEDQIERLKAAQQKPVAYINYYNTAINGHKELHWGIDNASSSSTPLYTAPPRKEWVGLTDEEIMDVWPRDTRLEFVRIIEAKLKEKNT